MNKLYTILTILLTVAVANGAERHVTSEPTLRGILLEEFTGIHCGYCPQGHIIANAMAGMHPDQVSVIAIHAGHYAVPGGGEPDFRTAEGTAINDYFGISGYPSGMVDRHDYGWGIVSSRSAWTPSARLVQDAIAEVNLWAEAVYDGSERALTIDVEGLYVHNLPEGSIYVNVAITQDRIKGPQNGSTLGNNYTHNHMLRLMATPVEGEAVEIEEDGFFSRRYTVAIPETLNDTEVDPLKIEAVVFITKGRAEVVNSLTVHPSYKNFVRKGNIELADDYIGHEGQPFAGNEFSIRLTNFMSKALSSLDYTLEIDGESRTGHLDFEDEIEPGECREVTLELFKDLGESNAKIVIKPTQANSSSVEGNTLTVNVTPALHVATEGNFVLRADRDFADNTWSMTSFDGATEIRPTVEEYTGEEQSTPYTLSDGEYGLLEVQDIWGDGVLNPRGIVKLTDTEGNMQAQALEINGFGTRIYVKGDKSKNPSSSLTTIEAATTEGATTYYSLDGRNLGTSRPNTLGQIVVERRGTSVNKIVIR